MVDFICMGKLGLQGAKTDNYKMNLLIPYLVTEATQTDRPKSVRNHRVIVNSGGIFVLSICLL